MDDDHGLVHPGDAYCPRSGQRHGPTAFPIDDDDDDDDAVWDSLTRYQQFLWLADELELRYQALRQAHPECQYYEMNWSTGKQLAAELTRVWHDQFGCRGGQLGQAQVNNVKQHIEHKPGIKNCTWMILQDLKYRQATHWTKEQMNKILGSYPQRIGGYECVERNEDLVKLLESVGEDLQDWVLLEQDR